jgi:hypothetical protein
MQLSMKLRTVISLNHVLIAAVFIAPCGIPASAMQPETQRFTAATIVLALEDSPVFGADESNDYDTAVDSDNLDTRTATDGLDTQTDTHGLTREGVESKGLVTDGIDDGDIDAGDIDQN